MPVASPDRPSLHPELTACAQQTLAGAEVELRDGHAWLLLKGSRWDLGTTPREARGKLEEQIAWFREALKTSKVFKS